MTFETDSKKVDQIISCRLFPCPSALSKIAADKFKTFNRQSMRLSGMLGVFVPEVWQLRNDRFSS